MMKNKIVALGLSVFTAFAGIGMLLGESKALSANAEEEITETASAQITATESTTATSTLETPSLTRGDGITHFCFGVYVATQTAQNGSYIAFKRGANEQYDAFTLSATYGRSVNYIVPSSSESEKCVPTCQVFRAYNSAKTITSDYNQELRSGVYVEAAKPTTGKTSSGVFPTSWNETGFVWEHGGSDVIYYSIAYNGVIEDRTLEIPFWGYSSSGAVEVNGMTFYVRTGPSKVSIKVDQSNVYCNSYNTMFAFYAK